MGRTQKSCWKEIVAAFSNLDFSASTRAFKVEARVDRFEALLLLVRFGNGLL